MGLGASAEAAGGGEGNGPSWGSVADRDRPTQLSAPGKERTGPEAGVCQLRLGLATILLSG